jgi:trehalose utilization protein
MLQVTIWNEYLHELQDPAIGKIYPKGIHGAIAEGIAATDLNVRTATLRDPSHGLTDEVLQQTDVLIWWGHMAHDQVEDTVVAKVYERVQEGMGLIVLHSGHASKIFRKLMGTRSDLLKWREADEKERLWVIDHTHPIVAGLGEYIELPAEEMYGETFHIPAPEELIFISWFPGGEVFRSGVTYRRGQGKVFYFRPGHETYPTYHNREILKVISNAVRWAAPVRKAAPISGNTKPLEPLSKASAK